MQHALQTAATTLATHLQQQNFARFAYKAEYSSIKYLVGETKRQQLQEKPHMMRKRKSNGKKLQKNENEKPKKKIAEEQRSSRM